MPGNRAKFFGNLLASRLQWLQWLQSGGNSKKLVHPRQVVLPGAGPVACQPPNAVPAECVCVQLIKTLSAEIPIASWINRLASTLTLRCMPSKSQTTIAMRVFPSFNTRQRAFNSSWM